MATLNHNIRRNMMVHKPQASEPDYLCFTANVAGATVQLTKVGSPNDVSLEYSTDRSTWSAYTIGDVITLTNSGDYVCFRATDTNSTFSTNYDKYFKFVLGDSIAASGNIMSLLDKTMQQTSVASYSFYRLFYYLSTLTAAPALPATTLAYRCYQSMFEGCTNLEEAPELPAIELNVSECYAGMFHNCSSLKSIKIQATAWYSSTYMGQTNSWMYNVASSGTFYCPSALGTDDTITRGTSYCPEGWTVVNTDV